MFRMNNEAPAALRPATGLKSTPGTAVRPARQDHVHSALYMEQVLFALVGANMNVTTDQSFVKAWNFANYLITEIRALNATANLTAADGGIYQAAAKAGDAIVDAAQIYTALDAATKGLSLTLTAFAKDVLTATPILSLTGAQGGAALCDFYIIGVPLTEGA